ncbi:MAG TPA: 4-hydroxy-tetrahydrodipicolinate synthase [Fimbriimonadales bacterium]|jgi:4-hydroxy-tetrahydrodipicolinate synthase|nr:4-hydroxy-tetrahydrodipicolinate synthase [Fimbriimonadales bacterium]
MGAFSSPKEWGPLLTAMATPMKEDGSVDYAEVERLAAHLVDEQRNTGIVVSGTTAESPTLSDSEKLEILKVILGAVRDRAAVVFGAGTYDTEHSIKMTGAATEMGAHGIMLVSPYYNKPSQEGLYQHFKTIAGGTDLPVMLYNIQGRTAVNIETPTLLRLASDVDNICAVKEASGSLGQIADVAAGMPDGFRIYSGDDALTLPVLSVGGIGVVSVAAHVAGKQMMEMMETFFKSPYEAAGMNKKFTPLVKAIFCTTSPAPVKYALTLKGFNMAHARLPIVPLTADQKATVEGAMRDFGLL